MARRRRRRKGGWGWRWRVAGLVLVVWLGWKGVDWVRTPGIVERVLYAETAGCSARERMLVAGVMKNRIGKAAFGGCRTLAEVAGQPGAFSCVGDAENLNWEKTRRPGSMTAWERRVWEACVGVVHGEIAEAVGPSGRELVYYHDKSIGKPASWDNGKWRAVREVETERLVFYSVVKR